jgi:hypothetical protein
MAASARADDDNNQFGVRRSQSQQQLPPRVPSRNLPLQLPPWQQQEGQQKQRQQQ